MELNNHNEENETYENEFFNFIEDYKMLLQLRKDIHTDIQNILLDSMHDVDHADAALTAMKLYELTEEFNIIDHHVQTYFQQS